MSIVTQQSEPDVNSAAASWSMPCVAVGRSVLVCAVHYVHADGFNYTGGAEKHVLFVVRSLLASGARVVIAYSGSDIYESLRPRSYSDRLEIKCVDWIDDVMSGDRRIRFSRLADRWRWVRAQRVDTAYFVQQASGRAFRASVLAARLAGLRVVCSLRQAPEPFATEPSKRLLNIIPRPQLWRRRQLWQYRLAAGSAHQLLYNSESIANAYESTFGFSEHKRVVVGNGVPITGPPRHELRTMRLGFVGRLTEAKGVMHLLEAFEKIGSKYPKATLTFFGDGPLRDALQARVTANGLKGRVFLPGYVANREAIFGEIDIYMHPSLREALPNSVLEAMAAGVPCIATDVGGTRDIIQDRVTGLLVPPNDVGRLVEALNRMATDASLYKACAKAASALIERAYDPKTCAIEMVKAILGAKR